MGRTAFFGSALALLTLACAADPLKLGPDEESEAEELPEEPDEPEIDVPAGPQPAAVRRLTDPRWRAAAESLTGVAFTGDLPLDYDLHGYITVGAAGITTSPYDLEVYEAAAWTVATAAIQGPDDRDAAMGCAVVPPPLAAAEEGNELDAGCVRAFVGRLAEEGWRRPPSLDEVAALELLFNEVLSLIHI